MMNIYQIQERTEKELIDFLNSEQYKEVMTPLKNQKIRQKNNYEQTKINCKFNSGI